MSLEPQRVGSRIGEVVAGRYRIVRLLGAGGMGEVFEAIHTFTQRRVALKLVHAQAALVPAIVERFRREAQVWTAIAHPGIAEVIDAGQTEDGTPYLTLELLSGESLASRIERGPLTAALAVHVGLRTLEALGAAHARGFVHRDVKPDNVFLISGDDPDEPGVKLLDFGIAQELHETEAVSKLTKPGTVLGTAHYMSPEQACGAPTDARTDLWSLGATLYHALTGRPPFDADNYNALIVSVAAGHYPALTTLRPGLSPRLVAAIERAMARVPAHRYATAEEMAADLRRALEPPASVAGSDASRTAPSAFSNATRRSGARVLAWLAGIAAVLAGGGVLAAWGTGLFFATEREPERAVVDVAAPAPNPEPVPAEPEPPVDDVEPSPSESSPPEPAASDSPPVEEDGAPAEEERTRPRARARSRRAAEPAPVVEPTPAMRRAAEPVRDYDL